MSLWECCMPIKAHIGNFTILSINLFNLVLILRNDVIKRKDPNPVSNSSTQSRILHPFITTIDKIATIDKNLRTWWNIHSFITSLSINYFIPVPCRTPFYFVYFHLKAFKSCTDCWAMLLLLPLQVIFTNCVGRVHQSLIWDKSGVHEVSLDHLIGIWDWDSVFHFKL
jgi:hypothetical protein